MKRLTCSKHSGADVSLSGSFEPQMHRLKVVSLRVITETDTPLEQVREVFDARKSADPSEPDVVVVRLVVVDQNRPTSERVVSSNDAICGLDISLTSRSTHSSRWACDSAKKCFI